MNSSRKRTLAVLTLLALVAPAALALGGSHSHYETKGGGKLEWDPNTGQITHMSGNARCDGTKVNVTATVSDAATVVSGLAPKGESSQRRQILARPLSNPAYGWIAAQVPLDTVISGVNLYTDDTLATPLQVMGELVVFNASAAVAARAEAAAGPAQAGFIWVGFRSNPLLEYVSGTFGQDLTWAFDFADYPSPGMIGSHEVIVYLSDNATTQSPMIESHSIY